MWASRAHVLVTSAADDADGRARLPPRVPAWTQTSTTCMTRDSSLRGSSWHGAGSGSSTTPMKTCQRTFDQGVDQAPAPYAESRGWPEPWNWPRHAVFSAVVSATPTIEDALRGHGCRAVTVSNFPKLAEFDGPAAADRRSERAVCYVGNISEVRGARRMVEAMAGLDAALLLAGRFSPPALRDQLAASPGWSRVVELGYADRAEGGQDFVSVKRRLGGSRPVADLHGGAAHQGV